MKINTRLKILFLFLMYAAVSTAQNKRETDSLVRVMNALPYGREKAKQCLSLGKLYCQSDLKKAMQYFNLAIEVALKMKNDSILANGYNDKGIVYINLGEQNKAIACFDTALKYHEQVGNKKGAASSLGNIGSLYFTLGDYKKSLEYQLRSLKDEEEENDKQNIGITLTGIANIYFVQNDFVKALDWYKKALAISREAKSGTDESNALYNIAITNNLLKKNDEATFYFKKTIAVSDSIHNKDGLASGYLGLGMIAVDKGRQDEALMYYKKSLQLLEEIGNAYRATDIYGKIADIYFAKADYKKCIEYNNLYLEKAKNMGMKQYEKSANLELSKCYSKLNEFEKAYQFQSRYNELKDTLLNEEKIKQVAEMQTKFETEKKEHENSILSLELSKSRYLMLGLGGLAFLAVIIAWLIIRQNKLKFKQTAIQLEQKLLRSQMNPHFIFNSLATIESFIYENQPKEAGRYLSDFARLMRLILENSAEEYIPLNKEIKTLEYYLVLQKLRLEDNLSFKISLEGIDETEKIFIPPMLTQPFIENAIEHGFRGTDKAGHIEIVFKINKYFLEVSVQDNGIGINKAFADKGNNSSHKSMAMQITKERLSVLNHSKRKKVTLKVHDVSTLSKEITGTRVEFSIPLD